MAIATRRRVLQIGAPVQQRLEESDLYTGLLRMDAGRDQPERGAATAVGVRLRVHLSAPPSKRRFVISTMFGGVFWR